jgi:hypothetical protein
MFKNKFSLLFLVAISLSQFSGAQNNTNSPYTRYGYGELSSATSGEQKAMGGVSIGARRKTSINTVNPASYSSVDSMTFMFDVGATGLLSRFSNTTGVTNKFTANLDYITMQFPVAKHVGFSAGLLPYSYAGYNYSVNLYEKTKYPTIPDFDTVFYRNSFNGYGTISQVYTGLGVDLFDHLSVGANVYYMFGSLYNTRSLRDKSRPDSTLVVSSTDVGDFRLRYGLQYHNTFAKKHDLNVGVVTVNFEFTPECLNFYSGVKIETISSLAVGEQNKSEVVYATIDTLRSSGAAVISNLSYDVATRQNSVARANMPATEGSYQYEVTILSGGLLIGFVTSGAAVDMPENKRPGHDKQGWMFDTSTGEFYTNGVTSPLARSFRFGETVAVIVNKQTGVVTIMDEQNNEYSTAPTDISLVSAVYPAFASSTQFVSRMHINFGQEPFLISTDDTVKKGYYTTK